MKCPDLAALASGTTVGLATQETLEGVLASTLATVVVLLANAFLGRVRQYFRKRTRKLDNDEIKQLEIEIAQRKSEILRDDESQKEK